MEFLKGGRHRHNRGTFHALSDVSFALERGKTFGLIGANGAGKSTALKLMSRIIEPTSGLVRVEGKIGALLELGAGFHPDLTGRENVYLNGSVMGFDRAYTRRRLDEIVAFSELDDFIDVPVKYYSSGMYVRLGFSVAVHSEPDILLIDEVLAVGDASFQYKCLERIAEMRRLGVTVVFVSHDSVAVGSLCDTALWFEEGRLTHVGDAKEVVLAYTRAAGEREVRRRRSGVAQMGKQAFEEPRVGRGPATTAAASADSRWGSRQVRIIAVELCDANGAVVDSFATGRPMEVRIHYKAQNRVVDPVFGLAIHHQDGTHVTGPNSDLGGLPIPYIVEQGVVRYRTAKLPLLEGIYLLSVSVHDRSGRVIYDYMDKSFPFYVYSGNSRERYGLITLGGCWDLMDV